LVRYGDVVSHPIDVIVGIIGAIVSNTTTTISVPALPAGSVTVTVGFEFVNVPVHTTAPPLLGDGVHISPGIVSVTPDSTPGQVIVTAPFVGFGLAIHTGTVGAVVSNTIVVVIGALIFPAGSLLVILTGLFPTASGVVEVKL
jgi:uncharacterized membrane protein YeaQ/YmgE (transglycosylase-associated protein family)